MMFGFARWPAARETGNEGMREGVNSLMRYARRSRALIPSLPHSLTPFLMHEMKDTARATADYDRV